MMGIGRRGEDGSFVQRLELKLIISKQLAGMKRLSTLLLFRERGVLEGLETGGLSQTEGRGDTTGDAMAKIGTGPVDEVTMPYQCALCDSGDCAIVAHRVNFRESRVESYIE